MQDNLSVKIKSILDNLKDTSLYRALKQNDFTGGKKIKNKKTFLNFSSNDYLDLSNNPSVKGGAQKALEDFGTGSASSRLMSGHLKIHTELEEKLSDFLGYESCLLFGSGFLANIGVLTSLCDKDDFIFADKLVHASLIDGMRYSKAGWSRYNHCDVDHLEKLLKKTSVKGNKIIITDSIFSMDGDIAPLKELEALAEKYNCMLLVDEAHAVGVRGNGSGICNEKNFLCKPDIVIGTLSKAFGSYGGFVCCSKMLKEFFVNKSRSLIYSTALPPSCCGAALASLKLIKENTESGQRLFENALLLSEKLKTFGFNIPKIESQIIPVIIGNDLKTLKLAEALREENIFATAIRPPTVPAGTSRIRISLTLAHNEDDIIKLAESISKHGKKLGVI